VNEKQTTRPTKKQRELLTYIEAFAGEHGYGPSYREIMKGCSYNSVATVALHVNILITRGHLRKKDRSARSLELTEAAKQRTDSIPLRTDTVKSSDEKWLVEKVDYRFAQAEQKADIYDTDIDSLYVLVGALKVLGLEGAAQSFMPRLAELKQRVS